MNDNNTGAIFIRGVGEAPENASLLAAAPALAPHGFQSDRFREVNWSWAEFTEWPYLEKGPENSDTRSTIVPRAAFLREIGFSFLRTAARDLPACSQWAEVVKRAVRLAMFPSDLVPVFIVSLPILLNLHLLTRRVLLDFAALLLLPIAIAVFSFESALVRATFRTVLLRVTWPVCFPIVVAVSYGWVPIVFLSLSLGLILAAGSLLPQHLRYTAYGNDVFEASSWQQLLQESAIWFLTPTIILVVERLLALSAQGFKTPLKVIADVVRYLGDSSYRVKIQAAVSEQATELQQRGCKRLFLFSHSLGTVIAIDWLRSFASPGFDSIILVTAGSPLRRFFWMFFSKDYRQPLEIFSEARSYLQNENTRFKWVNVYRRRDPVGGCLGLPYKHESVVAKPNETIWNAHLDYWSDPAVHQRIADLLART